MIRADTTAKWIDLEVETKKKVKTIEVKYPHRSINHKIGGTL